MVRYYFEENELESLKCTLVGFSDASKNAYVINIYLLQLTEADNKTSLVASKTCVTRIKKITVSRLEFLGLIDLCSH